MNMEANAGHPVPRRLLLLLLPLLLAAALGLTGRRVCAGTVRQISRTVYAGQWKLVQARGFEAPKECVWESSDPSVVTVTAAGKLHGVRAGSAVVSCRRGTERLRVRVTVKWYYVTLALAHTNPGQPLNEKSAIEAIQGRMHARIRLVTTLRDLDVNQYDGLVLPGGGDLDPARYGQENRGLSRGIDNALDSFQIAAVRRFRKAGKPILGICKGCQLLNVAYGGSLRQDIGARGDGATRGSYHYGTWRRIRIDPVSKFSFYGSSVQTLHWHHQAVRQPGPGLRVTMRDASDGTIEGIEGIEDPVYGIQWHPDLMGSKGAPIFRRFIQICRLCAFGVFRQNR